MPQKLQINSFPVDTLDDLGLLSPVMNTFLRKATILGCLTGFVLAIVTPAQAGRVAIVVVAAPVNSKPVISAK